MMLPRWQGDIGRKAAKRCLVTDDLALIEATPENKTAFPTSEKFQSKREALRYIFLMILQRTGKIKDLRRQVKHNCLCPVIGMVGIDVDAAVTTWASDFEYVMVAEDLWGTPGELIIEDCKGFREAMYRLKKKWLYLQEGLVIKET